MNQPATQQQQTQTLPAQWMRVPVNPYSQKMNDTAGNPGSTVTPPVVQNEPQPLPTDPQLQQPPVVQNEPPQPVQPVPPPPPPPPAYDVNWQMQQQMQQMAQQYQRMTEENNQLRQTVQNLSQSQQEYELLKQQSKLAEQLSNEAFENLNSVDSEDAKAISAAVLRATAASMQPLQQELQQQRDELRRSYQQQAQMQAQMQARQTSQEVLRYHPDFFQIQATPEYKQFMSQRDGYASRTRDEIAAEEFAAGNAPYVIDLLNQYKGNRPQIQQLVTVAPVQAAPSAVPAPETPQNTRTLRELNDLYQMRRISHEEYRAELMKMRAANPALAVGS